MSNHKHLADLLKVCSILPALAIMPAMAEVNTTGVSFLFGDISISDVSDIHYTAFGGHRGEWTDGKYNNSFPKYQMVGRSFELSNSVAYVGPVTINLRELTENDSLAYNYQKDGQDVDLAKLAGIDFGASDAEIYAAVAGVIGAENAEYTAPGVVAFANRNNTKEAGSLIFDKVTAVIDGATVNADTIEVKNGSSLSFVKQDPSLLSDATLFYTNKEDIASDGKTVLNANEITIEDSSIFVAEDVQLDIQGLDVEIDVESGHAVCVEQQSVINIGTETAGEIEISALDGMGIRAKNGAIVSVGNENTKSVDIESDGNYGVLALAQGAKVDIKGKNIKIATNADEAGAIHAGNNEQADKVATVDITGENIEIDAPTKDVYQGIGIGAMSWGIVNIEGNTTIRAQNAILARGDAQVNINKSGENTVRMLGDINFNYKEKTSDSPVNATIDVNLVGEESFWKGNTVVSWDDVMPDPEKLVVSNAKITLKDGAVWNATKITDRETATQGLRQIALNDLVINGGTVNIADTKRGIFVDRIVADNATFNGGMLNVNETIDITSGTTVFNSAVLGDAGVLNLAEGATLDIGTSTVDLAQLNIDGTVLASVLSDRSYGSLNGAIVAGENGKVQLNVGSVGSYKIFDSQADITVTAGATYDVSQEADGTVVITTKAVEDIAAYTGLTTQAAGAIAGLANSTDKNLQKISLAAQQVLNSGDVAAVERVERETAKLNPTDKPVAQATAASVQNQVLSLTSGRMAGGVSVGRAGGDAVSKENGFWMQGLFNKSKLADEFNGYTRGFALGADLLIDNKWTIGGGLAVNDSDVRSNTADIDIDSKTVFLYGQYKPNNWFVNATATYSMSEYTENKNPFGVMSGAAYDVESYGVQAMGGYDFATGITAEAGLRYLHIAQDAYTDDLGFKVKATDTDFLSGVAGLKYAFAIENDWKVRLRPELRAAMTYDFISDDIVATVAMPGVASYKVDVERLSRMGGEFGIGLTALYRGMEVSLMYDLDLHKDYTSQTGMIKFRGRF